MDLPGQTLLALYKNGYMLSRTQSVKGCLGEEFCCLLTVTVECDLFRFVLFIYVEMSCKGTRQWVTDSVWFRMN